MVRIFSSFSILVHDKSEYLNKYKPESEVVMKKIFFVLIVTSSILILSTCFFAGNSTVTVSPVIKAIGLPVNITSAELTVSGPGMNTIVVVYDGLPSTIELSIPSGSDRTFELVVYVDDPASAATSFKGTATADLSQGNATIYLTMGVNSTKLVIPDARNNRLVQIDDMLGTNWSTLENSDLTGWTGTYRPWDTDIDNLGRIIVANNGFATGEAIIWAVDSIGSSFFTPLYTDDGGFVAVTVDRTNDLIYFASSTQLYRCDYYGTNLKTDFDMAGIATITGMTYYDSMLYLSGTEAGDGMPAVFIYDPSANGSIDKALYTGFVSPRDAMFKDNYIYIADYDSASHTNHKITRLSTNLESPIELPNSGSHPMFGPQRFIAVLNKEIYFIDDADDFTNYDKFVLMNDIQGNGWSSYGTEGFSDGQFQFYYGC